MQTELTREFVVYAGQSKLLEIALELAEMKGWTKPEAKSLIIRATKIRLWLKALSYYEYLDKATIDKLVYCLADLSNANAIPVSPSISTVEAPSILVGIPGADGATGAEGPEGGGVPFSAELSATGVADSFDISLSEAAEWRIIIKGVSGTSGLRIMRLMGAWSEDGADYDDDGGSGQTIYGDTSPVTMSVVVSGTTAQLTATITSGDWEIFGTRVFIPPAGTSIISPTSLSDAKIWVGNGSNVPTAVSMSGDATLANDGELTITKKVAYSDLNSDQLIIKVLEIGNWDMDNTSSVTVDHNIGDLTKIMSVTVIIYNDSESSGYPLEYKDDDGNPSGYWRITDDEIDLTRTATGEFNSTDFNSSAMNRGIVKIEYIA